MAFCVMTVFRKKTYKFSKVMPCVYPTMRRRFKNFVQIIRTSMINKTVGYSMKVVKRRRNNSKKQPCSGN